MSRAQKIILLFYFAGVIVLSLWVPWKVSLYSGRVVKYDYGYIWRPPFHARYTNDVTVQWSILGMELLGLTAFCGFCLVLASSIHAPSKKEAVKLLLAGKRFLFNSVSDTPTHGKGYVYYLGEFTKLFFTFLAAISIFVCAYSALVGKWADAIWSFAVAAVILWLLWVKKLRGA